MQWSYVKDERVGLKSVRIKVFFLLLALVARLDDVVRCCAVVGESKQNPLRNHYVISNSTKLV